MLDAFEAKKNAAGSVSAVYIRREIAPNAFFFSAFKTLNKCPKENWDVCHQFQQTLQMRTLISGSII